MKSFKEFNIPLTLSFILIIVMSTVVLYSLDQNIAKKQLIFALLGIALFIILSVSDYSLIKIYWVYVFIFVVLVLLVTYEFAAVTRGSVRWLRIGFFNVQASELVKPLMISVLASYFAGFKGKKIPDLNVLFSFVLVLLVSVLVAIQPDLGTSLVFLFIYFSMVIFSKFNKHLILVAFILFGLVSLPTWNYLKDYQKARIVVFVNPSIDPLGKGYNVLQSKIAVGSGQIFGKGFGHGTQSRLRFLPEYYTDFIFASFSEEWGLVGVTVLLVLYTILLFSVITVINSVKDFFGFYICLGVFCMILFQLLINIGMNLGSMPVTGIPLPLMSYGGSSILTTCASLGLVNSVWLRKRNGSL